MQWFNNHCTTKLYSRLLSIFYLKIPNFPPCFTLTNQNGGYLFESCLKLVGQSWTEISEVSYNLQLTTSYRYENWELDAIMLQWVLYQNKLYLHLPWLWNENIIGSKLMKQHGWGIFGQEVAIIIIIMYNVIIHFGKMFGEWLVTCNAFVLL